MSIVIVTICSVIGLFVIVFVQTNMQNKHTQVVREQYKLDTIYKSNFGGAIIGINRDRKEFYFGKGDMLTPVPFNSILHSEITQNDASITSTSKSGLLAGALVGGAIAGGAGLVAGALSANSTSRSFVSNITLRIVYEGGARQICFLQCSEKASANVVKYCTEDALVWHGYLLSAMRQATDKSPSIPPLAHDGRDLPAKLRELWSLKEQGILSETEFEAQKARLLSA